MSINVLETEWWTLQLPPEWWAEAEDESILVGDRDDVGCIEISTLHKELGDFDAAEVARIAAEESDLDLAWEKVHLGDFVGVSAAFLEDEAAIREWYVARGGMLLYITYSCEAEQQGLDDAAVDEILATLAVV